MADIETLPPTGEASEQVVDTTNLVIGAGPAGLAVAACLRARGLPFEVVEARDEVGSSWRAHYDRLHLHTAKAHSNLPRLPMPDYYPTFPSRQQVVAYLDDYARTFDIRPRFGVRVRHLEREGGRWTVETDGATFRADHVIVATGYNRVPNRPGLPGLDRFAGDVLHSSEYRNGARWRGRDVLVVGCGNSGAEIALDLWEHGARPALVVRSPIHVIPRDLLGRPSQETSLLMARLPVRVADRLSRAVLRLVVGDLSRYGIRRPKKGPIRLILEEGRVSMLDVGTLELIRTGRVRVVPGITGFDEASATFADGRRLPFDAVVLATGFRSGLGDLVDEALLDARGYPRRHGVEAVPGLFFVGFSNPPTGALREIAIEAERVAARLAEA